MKHPVLIWVPFFLFLALGLSAMGWMSRTVLRLDQAQARATAAARLEENVRLALWRMDYTLAPVLSQETARPYFEYSPVFPAERAYTRMYTELKSGDVLVPSPLIQSSSPYILLYFQIQPDGRVTSPQAPAGSVRAIAESRYTTAGKIAESEMRLARLAKRVKRPELLAALPRPRDAEDWSSNKLRVTSNESPAKGNQSSNPANAAGSQGGQSQAQSANPPSSSYANGPAQPNYEQQALAQQQRGQQEFNVRQKAQVDNLDILINSNSGNYVTPGVSFTAMTPVWLRQAAGVASGDRAAVDHSSAAGGFDDGLGATLLLARRVSVNGQTYIQGCLLDWEAIRKSLLGSAADLLPGADLEPVFQASDVAQPRRLASIPARLVLPAEALPKASFVAAAWTLARSPTGATLIVAWLGVLLAGAAVAVLLRGVIKLSQRRAGFVSAVTHELRTPLTTLRMYTEMLAEGMVADPARQAAYHKTLQSEANRLGHLVDNVLLYSRLERSNRDTRVETARVAELLERLTPRLTERARQAGMMPVIAIDDSASEAAIRANLLSVEQILFNLVDNACKYAQGSADRRIELSVVRRRDQIEIKVADHGPGLDHPARARLFQPFSKSVQEAAGGAPGLGLGLALSYRLAKNMGAELRHVPSARGAVFLLRLPAG